MKENNRKSVIGTSIGFMLVITFCIINILIKFNYLDLSYLVVVVVYFALYLKNAKKLL